MKRIGLVFLAIALAGPGCVFTEVFVTRKSEPEKTIEEVSPPPAVAPEGISERNAQERARMLREELEHENRQPTSPPRSASESGKE